MKHPALARVFSVILAIMSMLTFFAGIKGFGDTADNNKKSLEEADKLDRRRLSYIELSAQLDGRRTYKEVNDDLEENREQHDSDAADHRTDLAEYSAKRGGYTMGADMLWEAKNEIAGAKQAFEEAKGMLLGVQAQKDAMNAAAAECNAAAVQCGAASAAAGATAAALQNKMLSEPKFTETEPPMPVAPVQPLEPVDPSVNKPQPPIEPSRPENEEDEEAMAEYNAALAEYQAALAEYEAAHAAWEQYNAAYPGLAADHEKKLEEYNTAKAKYDAAMVQYEIDKKKYDDAYQSYLTDYQTWYGEFMGIAGSADFATMASAGSAAASALNNAMAVMPEEMKNQMPGIDAIGGVPDIDITSGEPAAIINAFVYARDGFSGAATGLGMVSGGLGTAVTAMDNEIANKINSMSGGELTIAPGTDANTIIAMMDAMLKKGEGQVESGLADIWYNMGELEKDKGRLEEEKTTLDEEASSLQTQQEEADELKELERQLTSDRVVLTKVAEIKEGVDNGEKLEVSAERYIAKFRAETAESKKNGLIMSALAVAAGVMGILSIPAAYEKIKKRFWLLVPPALCGVLALGAMLLSRGVSDTLYYSTMATVIFAVIHLLVVIPKEKITV